MGAGLVARSAALPGQRRMQRRFVSFRPFDRGQRPGQRNLQHLIDVRDRHDLQARLHVLRNLVEIFLVLLRNEAGYNLERVSDFIV